jgi:hypothetical protein
VAPRNLLKLCLAKVVLHLLLTHLLYSLLSEEGPIFLLYNVTSNNAFLRIKPNQTKPNQTKLQNYCNFSLLFWESTLIPEV